MNCFFREHQENLYNCTKPYQYVGGEFLSYNKDFNAAEVKIALSFPDKYEIGISNHGVRVLYEIINKTENFMADRVYAPELDYKVNSLYGLESKVPLKEFDAIGFSLQYEMSYPTILKMLEMSSIPYRNTERTENDPIIFAGGPCAYNPLPVSDFIDFFVIGDGEDVTLEICETFNNTKNMPRAERLKALSTIKGVWAKGYSETVEKRISELNIEKAPTSYPIPYSSSVQDRAVIEIRRGCGRMCRFCQPGHVTLPIRERTGEEIVSIAKQLVENTGYDEYSLLSLSSNDYSNIKEVIKELSVDFNQQNISVSLPSQRIDGFNLELANLVQSVRKSTMTLAPEAGSQRLRNFIKKNISEEQILDAILTLYENGWSRVKLYFIAGLPTETLEDMDEMALLLSKIKYRAKLLKNEKNLKHGLDLTCTLSIFVPKPFTPLQWCGQMNINKVFEHIIYLKDKIKNIKGVKINYHDKFVSQIEAVLTKGDDSLCNYIEALYKKGCYLDAWGENFSKKVWEETSIECGLNLEELAEKQYELEDELPWDFINIGVSKEWLKNEYKEAFIQGCEVKIQPTCEQKCVSCGVCPTLKTKKVLAKPYLPSVEAQNLKPRGNFDPTTNNDHQQETVYKYRIKVTKCGTLRYFSHLDWQNTFLKGLLRTELNVAYSHGYNPSMKVSMGVALPLFIESDCELVDIDLLENTPCDKVVEELQKCLPELAKIVDCKKMTPPYKSIDTTVYWAEYKVCSNDKELYKIEDLKYNIDKVFSEEEVFISKKNKKGLHKTINIKPSVQSYELRDSSLFIVLRTGQNSDIPAVRIDDFINLVGKSCNYNVVRTQFFDTELNGL